MHLMWWTLHSYIIANTHFLRYDAHHHNYNTHFIHYDTDVIHCYLYMISRVYNVERVSNCQKWARKVYLYIIVKHWISCKQQIAMITKTCVNTISRCLKQLDFISFISLQIAITKTAVNTTRRCNLTSVLYISLHLLCSKFYLLFFPEFPKNLAHYSFDHYLLFS